MHLSIKVKLRKISQREGHCDIRVEYIYQLTPMLLVKKIALQSKEKTSAAVFSEHELTPIL